MALTQQPPSESGASASDARHYPTMYHHHHHPSPVMLQGPPPQQVASYVMAGPSGGHPGVLQGQTIPLPTPGQNTAYPSSTPGPVAFPGSTLNQPLLQQHTYIQQPVQQVNPVQLFISFSYKLEMLSCIAPTCVLCISYRCPRVTALQATTHTARASSSSSTGLQSARSPITALRTKTCPSNKVQTLY